MLIVFIFALVLNPSCGFQEYKNEYFAPKVTHTSVDNNDISDYFDWRDKNMVSPVKDQQDCAACWAFSVIANVESHLKIHRNVEVLLSEQFLIDCDRDQKGCYNGSITASFSNIVIRFGGVLREKDYPYGNGQFQCKKPHPVPGIIKVTGFKRVSSDENEMAMALSKYGPLAAAINSNSMANPNYEAGAIDQPSDQDCDPTVLNHSVLIVGYGVYNDGERVIPYWIIKNSWGRNWGDDGYYYLERGRNACGIANDVSFSIVT